MSVIGVVDCACSDFSGKSFPFAGPQAVWLKGQKGIRKALKLLMDRDAILRLQGTDVEDRILYHGGIHVDRVHVLGILDDDGTILYESALRKQTRMFGRVLEQDYGD
jgi:hypothetical protein